jgi:hypothetical protein
MWCLTCKLIYDVSGIHVYTIMCCKYILRDSWWMIIIIVWKHCLVMNWSTWTRFNWRTRHRIVCGSEKKNNLVSLHIHQEWNNYIAHDVYCFDHKAFYSSVVPSCSKKKSSTTYLNDIESESSQSRIRPPRYSTDIFFTVAPRVLRNIWNCTNDARIFEENLS